jgi:ElaB/YqjD/DUF883 family membrane-anchored ribosome-binding protein
MAEKSSELRENTGILSSTDRDAVSAVAGADAGDEFLEKYTDRADYTTSDIERGRIETNTGDAPQETEHIKAKIEETRSQMGETIDAIQEKLSFSNISEQVKEQVSEQISSAVETVKDSVYDATIGKARYFMKQAGKTEIVKTARANPFPFVLIGLGAGLLLLGSRNRSSYGNGGRYGYGGRTSNRGQHRPSMLKSATGTVSGAASSAYETVGSAASGAYEGVSNAAGTAYEGLKQAASSAYSAVNETAHRAYEKAGELGTQARESYDYYIEENPLAVGAAALALGAVAGLAIPATRYEDEFLGDYRQQVVDRVQNAAGDLVDRVKEAASEAKNTISEEVISAVDETQGTISDSAKKQGLTQ